MPISNLSVSISNAGTRNEVRMRVVNIFAAEQPGCGIADLASKYYYQVETLSNNLVVSLGRPARLNGGFDFVVRVPGYNFSSPNSRRRSEPKHEDIIQDLIMKKASNLLDYSNLFAKIKDVFECQDVSDTAISNLTQLPGLPNDLIIKTLKWLFIEQDIRYWNYSGRYKLWGHIPNP
jgi:hypothetical protein